MYIPAPSVFLPFLAFWGFLGVTFPNVEEGGITIVALEEEEIGGRAGWLDLTGIAFAAAVILQEFGYSVSPL